MNAAVICCFCNVSLSSGSEVSVPRMFHDRKEVYILSFWGGGDGEYSGIEKGGVGVGSV